MHTKYILLAAAVAVANPVLLRRDPSDKSGNSQIALKCSTETLPQPGGIGGQGEGGAEYDSKDLQLFLKGSTNPTNSSCKDDDAFCTTCTFKDPALDATLVAQGCSDAAAGGCSLTFSYNSYNFNTEKGQPYCGHTNSFGAFSDTKTALCYFNATGPVGNTVSSAVLGSVVASAIGGVSSAEAKSS